MRPHFSTAIVAVIGLCGLTAAFTSQSAPAARGDLPEKRILLVFRYDDFSEKSATHLEADLVNEFKRHKIACTFGVIPYVCSGDLHDPSPHPLLELDPRKAGLLKEPGVDGLFEVAQHGFSHQTRPGRPPKAWTEFSGRPLQEQIELMRKGRVLLTKLFGEQPKTFIPPWNSYDLATLDAARACGFSFFSADTYGPVRDSSLQFVPATTELRDLKRVCQSAARSPDPLPVIIALFHEYDFREVDPVRGNITLVEISQLLDWVASRPEIKTTTIHEIIGADAQRYKALRIQERVMNSLPWWLRRIFDLDFPDGNYPAFATIAHLKPRLWATVFLYYLAIFGFAAVGGCMIRRIAFARAGRIVRYCLLIAALSMMLLLYLGIVAHTPKHFCFAVALLGLSFGTSVSFPRKFRPLLTLRPASTPHRV